MKPLSFTLFRGRAATLLGVVALGSLAWLPLAAPHPLHAADTSPGVPVESRGLPRVLFNNDSDDLTWPAYPRHHGGLWVPAGKPLPLPHINSVEDYLAARIGPLSRTKVQGLSYCGNFCGRIWELNRDEIAALGADPLQPILQFWKRDGRVFFFSMRMNDVHHAFRNFPHEWNDFRRAHRHLFLEPPTAQEWETGFVPWIEGRAKRPAFKWSAVAFDYSRAEVRTQYLDTLREACRRYDLDGVELDWLRHPYLFREGEVNTATMTAFVHDARAIVDEAAMRRGHPVRLVSRVPATPEQALAIGLDVEAWLKAGWLDAVIAGQGTSFSSCPLEQWVALAHRHGVPVYGSLERRNVQGGRRFGSPETLRAAIATLWEKGADGIYVFNFYHREEMPLLDEFGDPARLARSPQEYFLESHVDELPHMPSTITPEACARSCAACALREDGPLPLKITPGTAADVSLIVAANPAGARETRLEILFQGGGDFDPPAVTLNGRPLSGFKTTRGSAELTLTLSSTGLNEVLKRGSNDFRFQATQADATLASLAVRVVP